MKILKSGLTKLLKRRKLRGSCQNCHCRVEVSINETKELIDRDTTDGMATRYVKCPECKSDYLWVK